MSSSSRFSLISALLLGFFAFGCGDPVSTPNTSPPRQSASTPRSAEARQPPPAAAPSEEAQKRFAERMERAVHDRDQRAFNRCIDWGLLFGRVLESLSLEKKHHKSWKSGLMSSLSNPAGFSGQVVNGMGEDGTYELLRLHLRDGVPYALFRLSTDDGINYHDYRLEERGGEAIATDIYIAMSGEHASVSVRRSLIPGARQVSKNWIQKLGSSDKALLEEYGKLGEMTQFVNSNNGGAALRVFDGMSNEMKELKTVQILRYRAASLVGERAIVEAFDDFARLFPNDDALALLSIDSYITSQQFDEALDGVDALDKCVGGDPYLDVTRANVHLMAGNSEEAVRCARAAVAALPEMLECRWTLVGVMLQIGDHAECYRVLQEMDRDFTMEWNDLSGAAEFADFRVSEQGQQWLREQGFLEADPVEEPSFESVLDSLEELAEDSNVESVLDSLEDLSEEPGIESALEKLAESQTDLLDSIYHTWTDTTGKFSVEAKLISVSEESVKLEKRDGRKIEVPLAKLSEHSRLLARMLTRAAEAFRRD